MSSTEPSAEETEAARRSGERRQDDQPIAEDRRQGDRRKRKPGVAALVDALLGKRAPR